MNKETLFKFDSFISHSGKALDWKIECDSLNMEDWDCFAKIISKKYTFGDVIGVPTGGDILRECLRPYQTDDCPFVLIVDDVLTTGESMERERRRLHDSGVPFNRISGIVIFAREESPFWITPIFQLSRKFYK